MKVLSAFSPVGSRARDEPLAQIQPRTATPTRSSSIARSMVTATNIIDSEENYKNDEFMRTPSSYGLSKEENKAPLDTLGRLSISGRLSFQKPPPPITTPIQAENGTSDKLFERFSTSKDSKPTPEPNRSTFERGRGELVSLSNEYSRPIESSRPSDSPALPEMIKSLVEKSITEAMHEIRNDIQNLHVDLIKQSLAQQVTLIFA